MASRAAVFLVVTMMIARLALAADAPFQPSPAELEAVKAIDEAVLRAHVKFLADDLLEGRAPGSRGDLLARRYIASVFEALGLRPGAPGGGWLQPVPLLGVDGSPPAVISFRPGSPGTAPAFAAPVDLRFGDDYIAVSGKPQALSSLRDAEVVFAGYGMTAPEYRWDDFKGADVRGKVLLIMNNDPSSDPALFAGETRLYYGRWDYKYEEAARKGAAAAFIIHTTPSAGYPWQVVRSSWTGEQFELRGAEGPRLDVRGWVTEDSARRIARLGGADLDALRRDAESRSFRPVPLGARISLDLPSKVRQVETANVLGILEGSDPVRKGQLVVFTAHHDHLGLVEDAPSGADRVYNGAVDNASGVAALLAIAKAFRSLPEGAASPGRSVLFAAVAAEEQGLLGSEHLAAHPPVPRRDLAADVNIDGIGIFGRTRDVTMVGLGKSTLDGPVKAVAAWQGRAVKPDQFPDRGFFYRSDQFSFARIGVPGVYIDSGTDFIGRPAGWGKERIEEWERTKYHQPSDEYSDSWDLSGAVEDVRLLFQVGLLIARDPALPAWTPGDEFEAARKAALEAK